MKIDMTTLLNGRCSSLSFEYDFEPKDTESDIILPEHIDLTSPVHVAGTITDKNNCMFLEADVTVKYHVLCDRCLDDMEETVTFPFERMISANSAKAAPTEDDEDLDILYVNESGVDIDGVLIEEISLELPFYHLCSEDCKGLCQKCGKNLNLGPCDCEDKKEIDPRLKILQKLLDNME
ncbi:MAG: DUF177 domain-containing protein [Ruminococcaceae bacterium]|nr:DUF177 domain-containing protein [Oscillospiraceae bacterium]